MQMLAPRLYFAMAQDGLFPAGAAAVHPRFGTPARAIATQAVLASVLVALGTFDTIVAYFVFITVVFIAATVASVFVLRRRDPAFHVPGYPVDAGRVSRDGGGAAGACSPSTTRCRRCSASGWSRRRFPSIR